MGGIFRLRSGRVPALFRRRSGSKWLLSRHSGFWREKLIGIGSYRRRTWRLTMCRRGCAMFREAERRGLRRCIAFACTQLFRSIFLRGSWNLSLTGPTPAFTQQRDKGKHWKRFVNFFEFLSCPGWLWIRLDLTRCLATYLKEHREYSAVTVKARRNRALSALVCLDGDPKP